MRHELFQESSRLNYSASGYREDLPLRKAMTPQLLHSLGDGTCVEAGKIPRPCETLVASHALVLPVASKHLSALGGSSVPCPTAQLHHVNLNTCTVE